MGQRLPRGRRLLMGQRRRRGGGSCLGCGAVGDSRGGSAVGDGRGGSMIPDSRGGRGRGGGRGGHRGRGGHDSQGSPGRGASRSQRGRSPSAHNAADSRRSCARPSRRESAAATARWSSPWRVSATKPVRLPAPIWTKARTPVSYSRLVSCWKRTGSRRCRSTNWRISAGRWREGGDGRGRPYGEARVPQRQRVEGGADLAEVGRPHRRVEAGAEGHLLGPYTLPGEPAHGLGQLLGSSADHRLVRAVVVADRDPLQALQRRGRLCGAAAQRRVDQVGYGEGARPQRVEEGVHGPVRIHPGDHHGGPFARGCGRSTGRARCPVRPGRGRAAGRRPGSRRLVRPGRCRRRRWGGAGTTGRRCRPRAAADLPPAPGTRRPAALPSPGRTARRRDSG